jgi:hypothetical protein
MMKQAQEEARLREIEEERIRRLEEDKRKEKLKVEVDGARPVTPVNAH